MEENIKLVENLIKEFETYNDLDGIQDLKPYMKALEHLIKSYKELQKYTDSLLGENEWYKDYYDCESVSKQK